MVRPQLLLPRMSLGYKRPSLVLAKGVRRPENERLVLWINYTAAGVVSGKKMVFTIEQVTQLLHSFPRTAVAVVMFPNRAADLRSCAKYLRSYFDFNFSLTILPFTGLRTLYLR